MNNNKEGINNLWMWVYRHQVLNSKNKEKGNTLIIAMSLGLIVLLATSVTLINSSKEKTNVQADEFTKQAMAVAELGVTRTHNFLAQNPKVAMFPKEENQTIWDVTALPGSSSTVPSGSYPNTSGSVATCNGILTSNGISTSGGGGGTGITFPFTQAVDDSNSSKGSFQVFNYRLTQPDQSTPADYSYIHGQNNDSTVATGATIGYGVLNINSTVKNDNKSRLEVYIPLTKKDPNLVPFPGVWLQEQNNTSTGNIINADLMVSSCENLSLNISANRKLIISDMAFPKLPAVPSDAIDIGSVTSDTYLPRVNSSGIVTDTPTSGQFNYIVSEIDLAGNEKLNIIPGYKVNIFLKGKADTGGSAIIVHKCENMTINGKTYTCDPTNFAGATSDNRVGYNHFNFKIFAYGHIGTGHPAESPTNSTAFGTNLSSGNPSFPSLCLNGTAETYGFIFAPFYTVGVAGTGTGNGFLGALWAQRWVGGTVSIPSCTSQAGQVAAVQYIDAWNATGLVPTENLPPKVNTIARWERKGN